MQNYPMRNYSSTRIYSAQEHAILGDKFDFVNFTGELLRLFRINSGITQVDMAESLDLSPSYYTKLESGHKPLTDDLIESLRTQYDIEPDDLLYLLAAHARVMSKPAVVRYHDKTED